MTERYAQFPDFDREAVSETLGTDAKPSRDVAHGEGSALTVGDGKAVLEVYPHARVARVTTTDARIEVHRVPGYALDDGHVFFEQGPDSDRTRLSVTGDGRVSFQPVPEATGSPTAAETAGADAQVTPAPPAPSEAPQSRGATTAANDGPERTTAEEPESVQLVGRLGRDPWFRLDGETPIGGFPLAINDPNGNATTWHKVVVLGEAAERLQEASKTGQIRKGKLVDVTGRTVVRQERTDKGARTSREIHASAVARVAYTKSQPPQRT
jgi:hypothetical protein